MYESKCGMICSECPDREKNGCLGCLNMEEAYWGEPCEIKQCCEGKKILHCGLCKTFPCELLLDISYDTDLGDDGERLMRLKQWADDTDDMKMPLLRKLIPGLLFGVALGVIIGTVQGEPAIWVAAGIIAGCGVSLMLHINSE